MVMLEIMGPKAEAEITNALSSMMTLSLRTQLTCSLFETFLVELLLLVTLQEAVPSQEVLTLDMSTYTILTQERNIERLCEGAVLINNFFELLPRVLGSISGADFDDVDAIGGLLEAQLVIVEGFKMELLIRLVMF